MKHGPAEYPEWKECPSGALEGMYQQLKRKNHARRLQLAKVVSFQLLLIAFGSYLIGTIDTTPHSKTAGITCAEVQNAILDKMFHSMDDEKKLRIQRHLMKCPHCLDVIHADQGTDEIHDFPCFTLSGFKTPFADPFSVSHCDNRLQVQMDRPGPWNCFNQSVGGIGFVSIIRPLWQD
tara:strand:+ start:16692 stop:17225 length:534 start_codon:yes stop_codon:yes gene_type:complete